VGRPVAVLGASGYAGGELIRLVDGHPEFEVVHLGAHTRAGAALGEVHPQLGGGDRRLGSVDPGEVPDVEIAFLALPHGASALPGAALAEREIAVVDLGSDYRFSSAEGYRRAYGADHPLPDQLGSWRYGLPELFGEGLPGADRVAVPGCYPTSAVLALAPLVAAGMIAPEGIVVDSLSGVTGAGRGLRDDLTFGAVAEGVRAYGVTTHRHRPEMEEAVAAYAGTAVSITFTPHLVPMQRGLLSTCYARPATGVTAGDLTAALAEAYAAAPFVTVVAEPPQTRWTVGSNRCLLAAFLDPATGTAVVLSALDNLLKGAAGQAVQCANLMTGLPESAGLSVDGLLP
jgi:N-acetyl-gamma-glutamyl-phosphate reductase